MSELKDKYLSFYADLEKSPDDWTTRLVFADWLQVQWEESKASIDGVLCHVLAQGQRWQVENKKRPSTGVRTTYAHATDIYTWFFRDTATQFASDHSVLSLQLEPCFVHLNCDVMHINNVIFTQFHSAELNLAEAIRLYKRCREVQDEFLKLSPPHPAFLVVVVNRSSGTFRNVEVSATQIRKRVFPEHFGWFGNEVHLMKKPQRPVT